MLILASSAIFIMRDQFLTSKCYGKMGSKPILKFFLFLFLWFLPVRYRTAYRQAGTPVSARLVGNYNTGQKKLARIFFQMFIKFRIFIFFLYFWGFHGFWMVSWNSWSNFDQFRTSFIKIRLIFIKHLFFNVFLLFSSIFVVKNEFLRFRQIFIISNLLKTFTDPHTTLLW